MANKKLNLRQKILVAGTLFGMFFGVPIFAVILTIIKEMASISRKKKAARAAAANAAPASDAGADRDGQDIPESDKTEP